MLCCLELGSLLFTGEGCRIVPSCGMLLLDAASIHRLVWSLCWLLQMEMGGRHQERSMQADFTHTHKQPLTRTWAVLIWGLLRPARLMTQQVERIEGGWRPL
jgi:hypothetical protein